MNPPLLAPSILAANHARLAEGLAMIAEAGASWVHLDIMDGHFVPNLSFGPETVRRLRAESDLFFDVHLMLDNPHLYIDAFADAGADQITIHVEPGYPVVETLEAIGRRGLKRGVVLNPKTPADAALPFLRMCDIVLLMTVQPGFGGQVFQESVISKMRDLDRIRIDAGLSFRLEVDGGIDRKTAPLCASAGVDTLVAGSAFFKDADPVGFRRMIEGD